MATYSPRSVREATHAGSWYTSSASKLKSELEEYLSRVHPLEGLHYDPPVQDVKAVIAP
jgi:predicted class III extradiol MEMO1 family dioxygenase